MKNITFQTHCLIRQCFIVSALLFLAVKSYSQTSALTEIPSEKVHLHLDRQTYSAGDTIWFKAYVVIGGSNALSNLSKTLNVELIDARQRVSKHIVLPVNTGLAAGDITLPDTLAEGRYRIRAYTSWMRNFGIFTFFEKVIPVVNGYALPSTGVPVVSRLSTLPTDIQFFPEGGHLVAGLRSKVGVKASGPNGFGKKVQGEIIDQNQQTVAMFESAHAGVGAFAFTPLAGVKYTARVKVTGEKDQIIDLPPALDQGFGMIVNPRDPDSVRITLSRTQAFKGKEVLLMAWGHQKIYFTVRLKLEGERYSIGLPWKDLPPGISRISLMADDRMFAERLIFNDKQGDVSLSVSTGKKSYAPGEQGLVEVQALAGDKPVIAGSFSMAVTNVSRVPLDEDGELGIKANLLLASDLKGVVERPNYYFNGRDNDERLQRSVELDNLLLTQGWRKFIWQENNVHLQDLQFQFPPEEALSISGKLIHKSGKPIAGSQVSLFATVDSVPFFKEVLTAEDGSFIFNELHFPDQTSFVIQSKDVKNKLTVNLLLDSVSRPMVPAFAMVPILPETDSLIQQSAKSVKQGLPGRFRSAGMVLDEVVVRETKQKYSSSLGGAGTADRVIPNERIKGRYNLRSAIESAEPSIRFDQNLEPKYVGRLKITEGKFITEIDGMRVDNGILQSLRPEEVESIEILMSPGNTAAYDNYGVIIINTKRGDPNYDWSKAPAAGIRVVRAKGYAESREFYTPKYSPSAERPDLRDVVYWNPELLPGEGGKATVQFFNSSRAGRYRIVVEGLTIDGKLGRAFYEYDVQ